MEQRKGRGARPQLFLFLPLFRGVRGRVILRTSPITISANFAVTELSEVHLSLAMNALKIRSLRVPAPLIEVRYRSSMRTRAMSKIKR